MRAKNLLKHDNNLLDKVAEKFISWDSKVKGIREDGVCFFTIENILKGIDELKAEVDEKENPDEEYVKQKLKEYTQWIFETTNVGCIDEPECMDSCVDCLINRYEREKKNV